MIKGAALLAVGFGLGYAKAMSDQEAIRDTARVVVNFLNDIALQEEIRTKQEADAKAATTADPATAIIPEVEVDEEPDDEPKGDPS